MTDLVERPLEIEITLDTLPFSPLIFIDVTEAHIMNGTPGDASTCAIAMAMSELGFREVQVGTELYWRDPLGNAHWAKLPPEADQFIRDFDAWGEQHICDDYCEEDCEEYTGDDELGPPAPLTFVVEIQDGPLPPPMLHSPPENLVLK